MLAGVRNFFPFPRPLSGLCLRIAAWLAVALMQWLVHTYTRYYSGGTCTVYIPYIQNQIRGLGMGAAAFLVFAFEISFSSVYEKQFLFLKNGIAPPFVLSSSDVKRARPIYDRRDS